MLRLSKKADYALIAMKHLAAVAPPRPVPRDCRAMRHSVQLMAKVLQRLVRTKAAGVTQGTWRVRWTDRRRPSPSGCHQALTGRSPSRHARRRSTTASSSASAASATALADSRADRGGDLSTVTLAEFAAEHVASPYGRAPPCCTARVRRNRRRRVRAADPSRSMMKLPIYMDYHATTPVIRVCSSHAAVFHGSSAAPAAITPSAGRPRPSSRRASGSPTSSGQSEGSHLHERRDRVEQPRDQGRRGDVPREGQSRHHVRDRTQGGHRHLQETREAGSARDVPARAEGRPDQPRRPAGGDHGEDDSHHDHDRQQRDRRDSPIPPRSARSRRRRAFSSTPTPCRRSASAVRRERVEGGSCRSAATRCGPSVGALYVRRRARACCWPSRSAAADTNRRHAIRHAQRDRHRRTGQGGRVCSRTWRRTPSGFALRDHPTPNCTKTSTRSHQRSMEHRLPPGN